MEHPIRLAGVLTILAKHCDQHMDPKEVHGTKITNLPVVTQEVDFLADNQEETQDTHMVTMVVDLAVIQEEAMDHQVDPTDQEDLLTLMVIPTEDRIEGLVEIQETWDSQEVIQARDLVGRQGILQGIQEGIQGSDPQLQGL